MKPYIFRDPRSHEWYLEIGEYEGAPIYVSFRISKDSVACAGDDGKAVCINDQAYEVLRSSPNFRRYLGVICEHELAHGPGHEHGSIPRPEREKEVLAFLREKGLLE